MNRHCASRLSTFLVLAALSACWDPLTTPPEALQAAYDAAVVDAATVEPDEISRDLTAIVETNGELRWDESTGVPRVLMVTWTAWTGYDTQVGQTIQTTRDIWVTAVPEVQRFAAQHRLTEPDLTLRLEQLLGLPPNNGKTRFVEFWVSPNDLFRPSPDPEISDHEAELDFPVSSTFVTVSSDYVSWFEDLEASSYGPDGYPWTRLGYTYDWGNPSSEVGLSEFVIRSGATVEVHAAATTEDYCRW
jgi:hypothetical protein